MWGSIHDGGGLRVAFNASDAVAKSGDDEEADEVKLVETVDLSELRGRIASWGAIDFLADAFLPQAQFLPNLDDLGYKSIVPSLRDFSLLGSNFSFNEDHNSIYLDDTFSFTREVFDDDDAAGVNDAIKYSRRAWEAESLSTVVTRKTLHLFRTFPVAIR